MSVLRISLFGAVRLQWNGQPHKFATHPKTPTLLAYLILRRTHPLEREQVAFTLWTDYSEAEARANLRRHLCDISR